MRSKMGNNKLLNAVRSNNIKGIEEALNNGVSIETREEDGKGYTPLLYAIDRGCQEAMNYLLEKGADANAQSSDGQSALHLFLARSRGKSEGVLQSLTLLIDKNADVNAQDKDGLTPLHLLMRDSSQLDIIALLLERGADVNARTHQGLAPLHYIEPYQHAADCITLLIKSGADVNARDNEGLTPLHRVAKLSVFFGRSTDYDALLALLIESGADVSAVDNQGRTAIHHVFCMCFETGVLKQREETLALLIEKGVDINAVDNEGCTALHRVFYDAINTKQENLKEKKATLALLIGKGADINARRKDGQTVLHTVVKHSFRVHLVLAMKLGADINVKNIQGCTPLQVAEEKGDEVCKNLLRCRVVSNHSEISITAPREGSASQGPIASSISISATASSQGGGNSTRGASLVSLVDELNAKQPLPLLLEKGEDVKSCDNVGRTALHYALERGVKTVQKDGKESGKWEEFIRTLVLEKGADINARTKDGSTALHYAVKHNLPAHLVLLMELGADINVRDNQDRTPLQIAEEKGDEICKALLQGAIVLSHSEVSTMAISEDNDGQGSIANSISISATTSSQGSGNSTRGESLASLVARQSQKMDALKKSQLALLNAVRSNDIKGIEEALNKGVSIEMREENGDYKDYTPLLYAIHCGCQEVMKYLLERGADPNASCSDGRRPLHLLLRSSGAMFANLSQNLILLIEKGADVNAQDKYGFTPLHLLIVDGGQLDIITLLIKRGADVNARTHEGLTPLHFIGIYQHAIKYGFELANRIALLRERGVGVHLRSHAAFTPLDYIGTYQQAADCIALLKAKGADINARNNIGLTPLLYALVLWCFFRIDSADCDALLALLIESGADVKACDNNDWTVLNYILAMAFKGVKDFVEGREATLTLLIGKGTDINAMTKDGLTTLHHAVKYSLPVYVQILMKLGADVTLRDKQDRTPLDLANETGDEACKTLLRGTFVSCYSEVSTMAISEDNEHHGSSLSSGPITTVINPPALSTEPPTIAPLPRVRSEPMMTDELPENQNPAKRRRIDSWLSVSTPNESQRRPNKMAPSVSQPRLSINSNRLFRGRNTLRQQGEIVSSMGERVEVPSSLSITSERVNPRANLQSEDEVILQGTGDARFRGVNRLLRAAHLQRVKTEPSVSDTESLPPQDPKSPKI